MKKLIFILLLFSNILIAQKITVYTNNVSMHNTVLNQRSEPTIQYDKWVFTDTAISWITNGEVVVYPILHVDKVFEPFAYTYKCMGRVDGIFYIYLRNNLVAMTTDDDDLLLVFRTYKML